MVSRRHHLFCPGNLTWAIVTAVGFSVGAAACGDSVRVVDARDPARAAVLPGGPIGAFMAAADGSGYLFAVNDDGLLRAAPADTLRWERVADLPFHAINLYAASPQQVFFIEQGSPDLWSWTGSEVVERIASSDSDERDGRTMPVLLFALAGDDRLGAFAGGDRGMILRRSGGGVTTEANPLETLAERPPPERYASTIWRVDAFGGRIYAASNSHLLERSDDGWRALDLPAGTAQDLPITAIAADGSGVLVALNRGRGPPRLLRHDPAGWRDLSHKVQAVDRELVAGRAQPDGSALFWAMGRFAVEVRGERVRVFDARGLGAIRGVARRGDDVVAGGTRDATLGIVVRLTD